MKSNKLQSEISALKQKQKITDEIDNTKAYIRSRVCLNIVKLYITLDKKQPFRKQ